MHGTAKFPPPYQKERKHRRFDLQFPVCLTFPSGGAVRKLRAISLNVSVGGLLLSTRDQVPPHTRVSLTMDVQSPWSLRPVRLRGEGEVVRVAALGNGAGFAVAVKCDRSITEEQEHLSQAC